MLLFSCSPCVADAFSDGTRYFRLEQYTKAYETWFKHASATSNRYSQFNVGFMFESGLGVEKNIEKAMQWYKLSAFSGYSAAQNNLGVLFEENFNTYNGHLAAYVLLKLSSEHGNATAKQNFQVFILRLSNEDKVVFEIKFKECRTIGLKYCNVL